jgi:hypothetical protein
MMKILLTITLASFAVAQALGIPQDHSGMEVLSLEVKEKLKRFDEDRPSMVSQKPPVIKPDPAANRGYDPNQREFQRIEKDTADRQTDLRSIDNVKREDPYRPLTVPYYDSAASIRNNNSKSVTRFVWAYKASPALQYTQDEEFLCQVRLKPGEMKSIRVWARKPRQKVVAVSATNANPAAQKPSLQDVIINQVQFADGTIWQRPNWNPLVLTRQGARKLGRGKCIAL